MKRSEMIAKMVAVLEETKTCSNESKAKAILAMQTEAGMKAPPYSFTRMTSFFDDDDEEVSFPFEQSQNMWEEEEPERSGAW